MYLQRIALVTTLLLAGFLLPSPITAAKKRVRQEKQSRCAFRIASIRKSPETGGIVISFHSLDNVMKLSYLLRYSHLGTMQGVGGSIALTGQTADSRNLYFGTCSSGVCTRHWPKTARVSVSAQRAAGSCTTNFLVKNIDY